jgi:hypothetical protein
MPRSDLPNYYAFPCNFWAAVKIEDAAHVASQIWIDIVDGKNVSAETTVLRGKGNGSRR